MEQLPRVLVVDDDDSLRRMLALTFELEGWDVCTAADGLEAVVQTGRACPDLVVLDIMMPRMDGLTVLGHIRRQPSTAGLPVILLSAKADSADIAIGMRAGATDYVTKPFEADDLLARAQRAVDAVSVEAAVAAAEPARASAERDAPSAVPDPSSAVPDPPSAVPVPATTVATALATATLDRSTVTAPPRCTPRAHTARGRAREALPADACDTAAVPDNVVRDDDAIDARQLVLRWAAAVAVVAGSALALFGHPGTLHTLGSLFRG